MAMLTEKNRKRQLKDLRQTIDQTKDPILRDIAYAMEQAVVYATEDTVGWNSLLTQAKEQAKNLHHDLDTIGDTGRRHMPDGKPQTKQGER